MSIRWFVRAACGAVLLAGAYAASAVPITSYRTTLGDGAGNLVSGTITATLSVWEWDAQNPSNPPPVLLHEFDAGIGNDFTVFVPTVGVASGWEAVVPPGRIPNGDYPFLFPGLWRVDHTGGVSSVDTLREWCSPDNSFYLNGIFGIAARGTCSFADKVSSMEAANTVGALIVNTVPGGAQQFSLGAVTPSIPVVFLSREAGERIVAPFASGSFFVYVGLTARWDPDPVSVAEPAAVSLFLFGLVSLALAKRRRSA